MTGCARAALLLAVALPLVSVGPAAAQEEPRTTSRVLFSFTDRAIVESSGLVDRGPVVDTVNDSGSGPEVYTVDATTGATVTVTTYSREDVEDVEALAPGPTGTVWVGDIGDNFRRRDSVSVYRVRVGVDEAQRFDLRYAEGSHDAETLLAHPGTGRLFVVTKTVFGGVVHAAPRRLRAGTVQTLRRFAQVPGLVTDGAFLPDGQHVLMRGYRTAALYTFPAFEQVAQFRLPTQRQGEALAVGRDGRILLSSEGTGAEVLEVELPPDAVAAMNGMPAPAAETSEGSDAETPRDETPVQLGASDAPWGWLAAGALGVGLLGVLLLLLRQRRDLS